MNGGNQTFETAVKYFNLADEYAPLYRHTEFQIHWAKLQRLTSSLIFSSEPDEAAVNEIFAGLDQAGYYLKTIILGRLFGYFSTISDFPNAVRCASLCIKIGERSNIMLLPTLAYGILSITAINMKDQLRAVEMTGHFLKLCSENGIYEYFRQHMPYDIILEFALGNGIEPGFARQMMEFAGRRTKKLFIRTMGGFSVYLDRKCQSPVKMRTKKERELFAFLLDAGAEGATKEQIYDALWSESESDNVKKLIGVNLSQIKKAVAPHGIDDLIINNYKHYSINSDVVECDIDLYEAAIAEFNSSSTKAAQKILQLYRGEYLSGFEALWATAKRIKYDEAYEKALKFSR